MSNIYIYSLLIPIWLDNQIKCPGSSDFYLNIIEAYANWVSDLLLFVTFSLQSYKFTACTICAKKSSRDFALLQVSVGALKLHISKDSASHKKCKRILSTICSNLWRSAYALPIVFLDAWSTQEQNSGALPYWQHTHDALCKLMSYIKRN